MAPRATRNPCTAAFALAAALLICAADTRAADRAIADVQMSRSGSTATAEFSLGCRMRYLDHSPRGGGTEVRIRLTLGGDCRTSLGGMSNELFRPPGRRMGFIDSVEFENFAIDDALLIVRFEQPVGFSVSQGAAQSSLRVDIDTTAVAAAEATPPTTSIPPGVSTPTPPTVTRKPLRPVTATPPADTFIVQLATWPTGASIDAAALRSLPNHIVYTQAFTIDGNDWTALRMGFFASEQAALAAFAQVRAAFPAAFVSFADASERSGKRDERDALLAAVQPRDALPPAAASATATETAMVSTMPEERVLELMASAKLAMRQRDHDRAVQIYMRLLEEPDIGHHREAREFLGVARQKKGQLAQARAEYTAYLEEFPDGADAQRVQQRLAALISTYEAPRQPQRAAAVDAGAEWNVYGGVSQYYRRDVSQLRQDEESIVNQSAILSHADLVVDRRGNRFDVLGRFSGSYDYDMLGDGEGPGDQGYIYFAYLDISDQALDLTARIGRQSRYTDGVLGRFDGAHVRYRWRPDISLNFTAGFPVYSPRYAFETRRSFVGASVDVENVIDAFDFNFFTHQQLIDGIFDRQSIGSEARYYNGRWNLVSLVDYDMSYNVLNTGMLVGNWQATDRLTLSGRYDYRAYPFITTGNALIGQPVPTIEELEEFYSEAQIRGLARDRTAQASSASFGFSTSVSERFQLSGDLIYSEIAETEESGGIAATPGTGPQYFFVTNLIGSSIFKAGDTAILGLRYSDTRSSTMSTAVVDLRYPLTNGLRVSPRLGVSLRTDAIDDTTQWILRPNLRLIYRWRGRFRLELEAGGLWSRRDIAAEAVSPLFPDDTEDSSAYYINGGYWVDF
jgi:tetratricopeptide (TPR) repeat protein